MPVYKHRETGIEAVLLPEQAALYGDNFEKIADESPEEEERRLQIEAILAKANVEDEDGNELTLEVLQENARIGSTNLDLSADPGSVGDEPAPTEGGHVDKGAEAEPEHFTVAPVNTEGDNK